MLVRSDPGASASGGVSSGEHGFGRWSGSVQSGPCLASGRAGSVVDGFNRILAAEDASACAETPGASASGTGGRASAGASATQTTTGIGACGSG